MYTIYGMHIEGEMCKQMHRECVESMQFMECIYNV